jgi:FkbM family methyltransferase
MSLKYEFYKISKKNPIESFYGVKLFANYGDATFRFYVIVDYGNLFSNFLEDYKHQFIFVDIGANQGLYSLIASKNRLCAKAFAFEPVSSTFELLEKNVRLNGSIGTIECHMTAIGETNSNQYIQIFEAHSGAASLVNKASNNGISKKQLIEVINHEKLNDIISNPEALSILVKVDTEGYEKIVIKELRKTKFWKQISCIFFEFDSRWHRENALVVELNQEGFSEIFRTGKGSHYDILMMRSK